jgi:hypothetical protein
LERLPLGILDSNPHSPVDLPAKENRKPPVTAPEVSPPIATLAGQQETVGLARWCAKPGYEPIFGMAGWRGFGDRLQVLEIRAQKKVARR